MADISPTTVKAKNYEKTLKEKRDILAAKLVEMKPGTDDFRNTNEAIKEIDSILNAKSATRWKAIQVAGLVILGALSLGFAHHDDIGDTIPGKAVSKVFDTIFKRV